MKQKLITCVICHKETKDYLTIDTWLVCRKCWFPYNKWRKSNRALEIYIEKVINKNGTA